MPAESRRGHPGGIATWRLRFARVMQGEGRELPMNSERSRTSVGLLATDDPRGAGDEENPAAPVHTWRQHARESPDARV